MRGTLAHRPFDGKMKITDWSKIPHAPANWPAGQKAELQVVNPATFFDELPVVMKQVPPLPGEEALYNWIGISARDGSS